MDAEIQKRNTDCVYFLASPLTCKKGTECEYRHSESARLNPRDCYYWLGGSCLNPNCSFRHPPLEGSTDNPSNAAHHQNSTAPTSKMNVPCYFFFNAYCIKGDKCPFLHGNDTILFQNVSRSENHEKTLSNRGGTAPALKGAASDGSFKEPVSHALSHIVPEVTASADILKEPSRSPELLLPEVEEPPVKSYDISGSGVEDANKGANIPSDQSSDDLVKDPADPDELGESSPGFDVLVDDESERLVYDDDLDYALGTDRDRERLHHQLMQYDFEGSVGYDPTDYPDSEFLGKVGMHEHYDRFDGRYDHDYLGRNSESSRERIVDCGLLHRRDFFDVEHEEEYLDRSDLRHRLKRRRAESHHHSFPPCDNQGYRMSPRRDLPPRRECNWEPVDISNGFGRHPKLLPDMAGRMIASSSRRHHAVSNVRRRHMQNGRRFSRRQGREIRPRERQVRRRPFLSSEISSNLNADDRNVEIASQPDTGFSGPKSLAEIKAEKRKGGSASLAYSSD